MARVRFPASWYVIPWILLGGSQLAGPAGAGARAGELERIADTHFDSEFRREARGYHRPRTAMFLLELAVTTGVAIWILTGAGSGRIRDLVSPALPTWAARLALLTASYLGFALLRFPFRVFFYAHARQAGLRHDPWTGFLADWSKGLAIGWVQVALAGLLVLWLLAVFPRWGWVWGTAGIAVLAAAFIYLAPLVVDPLFHRFRPLENSALADRLKEIAERGGIEVRELLVADASRRTRAVNAYFTGLGRSKRIVLYDTLVNKLAEDEIAVVVAHELGHWRHRHVVWGLAGGILGGALGLWILFVVLGRGLGGSGWVAGGRGDPLLAVPAYALSVILLTAAMVPANLISRGMETQADRASLELTGDPEAFVRSEVRIARENLSDVLPPPWVEFLFYTHPSAARRILLAEGGP